MMSLQQTTIVHHCIPSIFLLPATFWDCMLSTLSCFNKLQESGKLPASELRSRFISSRYFKAVRLDQSSGIGPEIPGCSRITKRLRPGMPSSTLAGGSWPTNHTKRLFLSIRTVLMYLVPLIALHLIPCQLQYPPLPLVSQDQLRMRPVWSMYARRYIKACS